MHADVTRAISRINEMLTWLTTLANAAETHFWNTAGNELAQLGAVSADPLAVSDDLCLGTTEACEIVLRETALVTGASHTPLDWAASLRTLTPTTVSAVASGVRTALNTISTVASPPSGGYTHQPMAGAGANIYNQVRALIEELGPKFPTPITCFYPDINVTGITAEIETGDLTKVKLTVTGSGSPTWPAGASWHQLAAGDVVVFTALEMTTAAYQALVNEPLVVSSVSGDDLFLTLPEAAGALVTPEALTDGTGLRDLFVLRKIRGNEA